MNLQRKYPWTIEVVEGSDAGDKRFEEWGKKEKPGRGRGPSAPGSAEEQQYGLPHTNRPEGWSRILK